MNVARATPRGHTWVRQGLHRIEADPVVLTPTPLSEEMVVRMMTRRLDQLGWTITNDSSGWVGVHRGIKGCIQSDSLSGLLNRANERV